MGCQVMDIFMENDYHNTASMTLFVTCTCIIKLYS